MRPAVDHVLGLQAKASFPQGKLTPHLPQIELSISVSAASVIVIRDESIET